MQLLSIFCLCSKLVCSFGFFEVSVGTDGIHHWLRLFKFLLFHTRENLLFTEIFNFSRPTIAATK